MEKFEKLDNGGNYNLIEFYGETCADCTVMAPLIDKLEKEIGERVFKIEVWKNKENMKYLEETYGEEIRKKTSGSLPVPLLINKKTGAMIIESATYPDLKKWAQK